MVNCGRVLWLILLQIIMTYPLWNTDTITISNSKCTALHKNYLLSVVFLLIVLLMWHCKQKIYLSFHDQNRSCNMRFFQNVSFIYSCNDFHYSQMLMSLLNQVTLKKPGFMPLIQNSDDQSLRETSHRMTQSACFKNSSDFFLQMLHLFYETAITY